MREQRSSSNERYGDGAARWPAAHNEIHHGPSQSDRVPARAPLAQPSFNPPRALWPTMAPLTSGMLALLLVLARCVVPPPSGAPGRAVIVHGRP